jgi:tryptophan halogenase
LLGQGVVPKSYHPSARSMKDHELSQVLAGLRNQVSQTVSKLPKHQEFINSYCKISA